VNARFCHHIPPASLPPTNDGSHRTCVGQGWGCRYRRRSANFAPRSGAVRQCGRRGSVACCRARCLCGVVSSRAVTRPRRLFFRVLNVRYPVRRPRHVNILMRFVRYRSPHVRHASDAGLTEDCLIVTPSVLILSPVASKAQVVEGRRLPAFCRRAGRGGVAPHGVCSGVFVGVLPHPSVLFSSGYVTDREMV